MKDRGWRAEGQSRVLGQHPLEGGWIWIQPGTQGWAESVGTSGFRPHHMPLQGRWLLGPYREGHTKCQEYRGLQAPAFSTASTMGFLLS